VIEKIEQPDDHFDFIWCRDVLELVIGTEWREHEEERTQPVSRDLLRLARLRRRREEIVEEYGQELYDVSQASLQWKTYLFLGKLQPTMYLLKRGA
jgi:hypothetical protein